MTVFWQGFLYGIGAIIVLEIAICGLGYLFLRNLRITG